MKTNLRRQKQFIGSVEQIQVHERKRAETAVKIHVGTLHIFAKPLHYRSLQNNGNVCFNPFNTGFWFVICQGRGEMIAPHVSQELWDGSPVG